MHFKTCSLYSSLDYLIFIYLTFHVTQFFLRDCISVVYCTLSGLWKGLRQLHSQPSNSARRKHAQLMTPILILSMFLFHTLDTTWFVKSCTSQRFIIFNILGKILDFFPCIKLYAYLNLRVFGFCGIIKTLHFVTKSFDLMPKITKNKYLYNSSTTITWSKKWQCRSFKSDILP